MRYWAVPMTFVGGLLFTVIWDLVDGPEDVPPWFDFGCD